MADAPGMAGKSVLVTGGSQSKLANVMFTYELARRLDGTGVSATVLHPAWCAPASAPKTRRRTSPS
jgi:NAD(P)-dependent dehydrogenase (short-subunit alcohol dehydrogenase family)